MTFLICSLMLAVLVEAEPSDDITHSRLADLVESLVDIFNHDHRLFRIGNMVVGDRSDIDRDVVLGDDFLRGDLHRDSAQGDAHHLLNGNEDERDPRSTYTLEYSEKEYDTALVFPKLAQRSEEIHDVRDTDDTENVGPTHGGPSSRPNGQDACKRVPQMRALSAGSPHADAKHAAVAHS